MTDDRLKGTAPLIYALGPVEPGSIIVIDEEVAEWTDDGYDELPEQLLHMILGAVGHMNFVVVRAPHGTSPIDIIGPSEALSALATLSGVPNPLDLCKAVTWLQKVADAAVLGQPSPDPYEGVHDVIAAAHRRVAA